MIHRQSAVIPYLRRQSTREILLIASSDGTRWTIPKGMVEPGLSPAESAVKEAFEEAGIMGRVRPQPIGSYSYQKWGATCQVDVFVFEVTEELDVWPEANARTRQWLNFDQAVERVAEDGLKGLIRSVGKFLLQE